MANDTLGLIDAWLVPLRKLRAQNAEKWHKEGLDEKGMAAALIEANVKEGVRSVRAIADVINAEKERGVVVHGCVYDISCGELKEVEVPESEVEKSVRLESFALGAGEHH